jgi:hypothetical protein
VVEILDPLSTLGMTTADVPRLREAARDAIAKAVTRLRGGSSL